MTVWKVRQMPNMAWVMKTKNGNESIVPSLIHSVRFRIPDVRRMWGGELAGARKLARVTRGTRRLGGAGDFPGAPGPSALHNQFDLPWERRREKHRGAALQKLRRGNGSVSSDGQWKYFFSRRETSRISIGLAI